MGKQSSNLLNLTQSAEAVGVTRKTLYTHIDKGLISVTRRNGKRFIDVSELVRHYGSVSLPVEKVNTVTRSQPIHENTAILDMQRELSELRKLIEGQQLLLESKQETESLKEERDQALLEVERVKSALEAERNKGFWQRLFG